MNAPTLSPKTASSSSAKALCVVPLLHLRPDQVEYYFQRMYSADTLRFSFCDIIDPTWSDVKQVISRIGNCMYLVIDPKTDEIEAEFTLENFTGRAAQAHFSTSPDIATKERIDIGRMGARHILTRVNPETGEYFLDALYGLTPLVNRAARIFALKIGYVRQGTLPSGLMHMGKPEDCMISVVTRETLRG